MSDNWLIQQLKEQDVALAGRLDGLRRALDEAAAERGQRLTTLLAGLLHGWRASIPDLLRPEPLFSLLAAACVDGVGRSQRTPDTSASQATLTWLTADPPTVAALAELSAEQRAGVARVSQAAAGGSPSTLPETLLAVVRTLDDAMHAPPLDNPEVATVDQRLRSALAAHVCEVSLFDTPEGKRRPRLDLAFPPSAAYRDDAARWLERDLGRRLRPLDGVLRTLLPQVCRMATLPLCVAHVATDAPALAEDLVAALACRAARQQAPAREDLLKAMETFCAGNGAAAALLGDDCGRESDIAWLMTYLCRYAKAQGAERVVCVDCGEGYLRPTLADVLERALRGLGLEPPPREPAGVLTQATDPGGAGSARTRALTQTLLESQARGMLALVHVGRLRREELRWLGTHVVAPLVAGDRPPLRVFIHGSAKAHGLRLLDFFPGAFAMVGEIAPFTIEGLQRFLLQEAGYPEPEAAERAQRAIKLTKGQPLGARVLLQAAMHGQAW